MGMGARGRIPLLGHVENKLQLWVALRLGKVRLA